MASHVLVNAANSAYLVVVLHLLFALAACGHSATAVALLVVFACGSSLETVTGRTAAAPSDGGRCRQRHPDSELVAVPGRTRETFEPLVSSAHVCPDAGDDGDGVSLGQCRSTSRQRYRDLASATMRTPYDDDCRANEPCRAEDEAAVAAAVRDDGYADLSVGLYSPAQDAGVDETLIYPSDDRDRQPCGGPAVRDDSRVSGDHDVLVPQVSPQDEAPPALCVGEHNAEAASDFHLAPRLWWVWVTAVCSLAQVCASALLFSLVGLSLRTASGAAAAAAAVHPQQERAPAWATTPAAQVLLYVFAGVDLERAAPHTRVAWTTACFGVVSVTSWCLFVFRVVVQWRSSRGNSSAEAVRERPHGLHRARLWGVVQLCGRGVRRGGRFAASVPISLAWIGVAGVGQTSLLGLAALLLVVGMALHSLCTLPRSARGHRSARRDLSWAAYVSVLWLLWEAQVVLRLNPVRRALIAGEDGSTRRRWLAALGVAPADSAQGGICGWHVVFAIGLWCATAEQLCHRAAACGKASALAATENCGEASTGAHVEVYRTRITRAMAHQEEAAWTAAVNQQRAAHGKLALLRLERGAFAARSCSPPRGTCARGRQRGGVRPLWRGDAAYEPEAVASLRRHAPFGSTGSRCCWLDAGASLDKARATAAARGPAAEGEAGFLMDDGDAAASSHAFTSGGLQALPRASPLLSLHGRTDVPRPSSAVWSSSPWHSLTSAYSCLAGRRAPWQYSALPTTAHATPVNAEPVADAAGTAQPSRSPVDVDDDDAVTSRDVRRRAARAPTQSPCRGGDYGNSDAADDATKCEYHRAAPVSGSVRGTPHWRSPLSSRSGTYSPVVFSVAATGPRAASAGLRRTTYTEHASSCQSGGSVYGFPVIDPPPSPRTCEEVAASWEALWHGAVSVAASPKPDDVDEGVVRGASLVVDSGPTAAEVPDCEERSCRRPWARLSDAVRSRAGKLARRLHAWLLRHTIVMAEDGAEDEVLPQAETGRSATGTYSEAGTAAAAAPQPDAAASRVPLRRLLALFARQHWALLCALLMLIHFAVSGTVVNLVPSAASLVYALERRPWPRAAYWRLQGGFAALALLGKVAARVYVATVPVADEPRAYWWIDLLLLRVDTAAAARAALGGPSGPRAYRDTWVDVALAGAVLAALAVQWGAVYADVRLLWPERGDTSAHVGSTAPAVSAAAAPTPATAQLPGLLDAAPGSADPSPAAPPSCPCVAVAAWLSACKALVRRCNGHRRGAGADYYAAQLCCDAVSLGLFGWAYYAIVPNDTAASENNLVYAVRHNRLPGIFVATALGLVVLMFAERILYVLQARVAKYALHCLLAATYHALYLVWRVERESCGGGEDVERAAVCAATSSVAMTASVSLLLTAKLASLWFSALQLRHGYAVHRLHDPFTVRTDVLHWLGHVAFRAVPFLLELRVLLDWSFSATTLKVQHWMLLEDIHHTVYRRYVDIHDLRHTSRHQGRRFPYVVRLYQGVLGFAVILFVLFFPLFWYSTFSPQVRASHVTVLSTDIAVDGLSTAPLFSADATLTPSDFYHAAAITFSGATISAADLLRYASVTDTWQTARVASCGSRMWSYTPAAVDALISHGGGARGLRLRLRERVTRSHASEATLLTVAPETSYALPAASQARLLEGLQAWRAADEAPTPTSLSSVTVALPALYTPYVLSASAGVTPMSSAGTPAAHCALTLHRVGRYQGYSCVACAASESGGAPSTAAAAASPVDAPDGPFLFVVASRDVATEQSGFSLIPNVGIIALYTSFVFVMSVYIRNYFAGDAHRVVLLQLANPEPVAELLRYLYLARSSANNGQTGDLFLEQLLFLELLDLLRSPERLLCLGGRRVDDYEGGLYRAALYEAAKQPFALPGA